MNGLGKNLLDEINRVRTQPQVVAQELETYKNYYKGLEVSIPGTNSFKTIDGVEGLLNALEFLQQMKPISPLQSLSAGLSRSAQDLCDDNGSKGLVGNTLSDGTSAPNRWSLYGTWKGKIGENIYFRIRDPKEIVFQWIIDDGNRTKPNRRTIMDEQYTMVGIGSAEHTIHGVMVSAIFTISYKESDSFSPSVEEAPLPISSKKEEKGGNNYIIETEYLGENIDINTLKLTSLGKMLTLTRTFLLEDKMKRKNSQWQLPFSFDSTQVVAKLIDQKIIISIPKNIGTILHETSIGKFTISPNLSQQNYLIQVDTNFGLKTVTLSIIGSIYEETINITLKGDIVAFNSHRVDVKGETCTHTVQVRLPFIPTAEQFSIVQEFPTLTLSISKVAQEEKIIPILIG